MQGIRQSLAGLDQRAWPVYQYIDPHDPVRVDMQGESLWEAFLQRDNSLHRLLICGAQRSVES